MKFGGCTSLVKKTIENVMVIIGIVLVLIETTMVSTDSDGFY